MDAGSESAAATVRRSPRRWAVLGWLAASGFAAGALGQAQGGVLRVVADAVCRLQVDGHDVRTLAAGEAAVVPVEPGIHLASCTSTAQPGTTWRSRTVRVGAGEPVEVRVALLPIFAARRARAAEEAEKRFVEANGYWIDRETGFWWTPRDNGVDVDWASAKRHCEELTLGGRSDWWLPAIRDLRRLHEPDMDRSPLGIRRPLDFDGLWAWSDTRAEASVEIFEFLNGKVKSSPPGQAAGLRALCVRGTESAERDRVQAVGFWADPRSGLLWAARDNGSAIEWPAAKRYCAELLRGGLKGWRLPTLGELGGLRNAEPLRSLRNVRALVETTEWWFWSSTSTRDLPDTSRWADPTVEAGWAVDFATGDAHVHTPGRNRALCVREPEGG